MCILNYMLVTIHCYTAPIPVIQLIRMKLPYSDEKKNSASFMNIAKAASFHLKTKYKHLRVCSQIFLHLENYHNRLEHCFLVNCIISILLRQSFILILGVFPLINPKSNTIILKVADYNSKNF